MTKVTPPFYSSWDHVMLKHASWALLCSVTLSSLRLTPVGLSPISRLHLSHALRTRGSWVIESSRHERHATSPRVLNDSPDRDHAPRTVLKSSQKLGNLLAATTAPSWRCAKSRTPVHGTTEHVLRASGAHSSRLACPVCAPYRRA